MKKANIKKRIVLLAVGLIIALSLSLFYGIRMSHEREKERELFLKAAYASYLDFAVNDRRALRPVISNPLYELRQNRRNPDEVQYTEIVLVHDPEEAARFEEHVLVAWPRNNVYVDGSPNPIRGTHWMLDALNKVIPERVPNIDFRDYGLPENEITIIDIVDNWEIVEFLIREYLPEYLP